MTKAVSCEDVQAFRALIAERLGLALDEAQSAGLDRLLQRRAAAAHSTVASYLKRLEAREASQELRTLAPLLTVGETHFFRWRAQFEALREHLRRRAAEAGQLRVLSAACATGEEPFTVAIVAREVLGDAARGLELLGVDVNPVALSRARAARYSDWSLRETRHEVRSRWFVSEGRALRLRREIREAVRFEEANLAEPNERLWGRASWDVVFCRNVLIYFTPAAARRLLARVAQALRPGGLLFLGHAETPRGLSEEFHLRQSHEAFFYERRAPTPASVTPLPRRAPDVRRAPSRRVAAPARMARASLKDAKAAASGIDLTPALQLVREERYAEALQHLRALPSGIRENPEALLLSAVLEANAGRLEVAERLCEALLEQDDLNAGAHYIAALCRAQARDVTAALDHDRAALYLAPGFALARLHLGMLERRAGDVAGARRELLQAMEQLASEDDSRLLLYGGGFDRASLMQLCRAELRACGGEA